MQHEPTPWDDVAAALVTTPIPTTQQAHGLVEAIPDDARAVMLVHRDPASLDAYLRDLRSLMRERVRDLYSVQLEQRIDTGTHRPTVAALEPEARLLADIVDVLEGIRAALAVGVDEAKSAAAEVLAEVIDVKDLGTTSQRFGGVRIANEQASALAVDERDVISAVAEYRAEFASSGDGAIEVTDEASRSTMRVTSAAEAYELGIIEGAHQVLSMTSSKWKTTALKSLIAEMQGTGTSLGQTLAVRLELAQSRKPTGNPRTKIER